MVHLPGIFSLKCLLLLSSVLRCPRLWKPMSRRRGLVSQKALKPPLREPVRIWWMPVEPKTLAEYTRADTLSYRDYLIAKGLVGSSVSRVMTFKFVLCAGREFLRFLLLGVFIRRFSRLLRIESDKKLMGCIKAEA
jgi:hypothetical protein